MEGWETKMAMTKEAEPAGAKCDWKSILPASLNAPSPTITLKGLEPWELPFQVSSLGCRA